MQLTVTAQPPRPRALVASLATIARLAAFSALTIALGLAAEKPARAETWDLDFNDVHIVTQREASGDRPYFGGIYFRSRLNTPGSTEVESANWEPHDWVSKPLYRVGLPAGRDHLFSPETVATPFWMGHHQWRKVTVVPDPITHLSRLNDALHAEIIGGFVFSFDNNNTPPHVIRGILDSLGTILQRLLVEQVESGRIVASLGNPARLEQTIKDRAAAMAKEMLDIGRAIDLAGQLTVGSTFNPDQPTGVQAFILPAIGGIAVSDTFETIGPMKMRLVVGSLGSWREATNFNGSGAAYQSSLVIDQVRCDPGAPLTNLTVSLRTGEDDLRDNTVVRAFIDTRRGRVFLRLPTPGGIGSRGEITRTLLVPAGIGRGDVSRFGLAIELHNTRFLEQNDRWDVDAVKAVLPGETMVMQTGRSLVQLNDRMTEWSTDVTCTREPPDPIVSSLEVTVRTGADDLRLGSTARVSVPFGTGSIEAPLNTATEALPKRSSKSVVVTLPAGTHLSQLHDVVVSASFATVLAGDTWSVSDNWIIDELRVRAILPDSPGSRLLLDNATSALARLGVRHPEVRYPLRP